MNDRLTPELVLSAYCQGCFPMADPETGEISFYEPDPRALIPLDDRFHIPHGLKRALNKKPFELRMDTAFPEVIHACARTDQPEEQWIDGQIEEAYGKLHEMGFAHSVECWDEEGLQGGLYGVALLFSGKACSTGKRTPARLPWWPWCNTCGRTSSFSWIPSGQHRIC